MLPKLCATASGLVAGGFLFFRYSRLLTDNFWGLQWYEAALLFAALGLVGLFPGGRAGAVLGTALAACLGMSFQIYSDLSRNPRCCNLWPIGLVMWFFLGFPAPLLGGVIGYLISVRRVSRAFFLILLAVGVGIGVALPLIQQNEYRRIETKEIPTLVRRIYEAETSYSAKSTDHSFTCDGRRLPGALRLGWMYRPDFIVVQHYTIKLECPNEANPRSFRVTAFSRERTRTGPTYSIDQTGELVDSSTPTGEASKKDK